MLEIYIDADACPVKDEVYRVAERYGLNVILVANTHMRIPWRSTIRLEIVGDDIDEADDWIADHTDKDDIVITNDVPLASRCVSNGARVLSPTGRIFTETNMGEILATRDLLTHLREAGDITSGPPPFSPRDRSTFLQRLDQVIQTIKRG